MLRVYLGESETAMTEDMEVEDAVMLECNIDDMNPEWYTHISDLLFKAGAVEVFITPVVMKKSRPGHLLSVLSSGDISAVVKDVLFKETASIGLREYSVRKSILRREIINVKTKYGEVEVKRSYYKGAVVNEKPEFEQCRQLAARHKVSLEEIRKEVYNNL